MANDVCNNGSCGTGGWNGPLPGDPDNSSVLSAVSDYGGIQLSWTVPNINGFAVSYTRIFRSTGNEFATAIPLPPVSGCTFFDRSAAEVIRPYHYWIQNVSANGTELAVIGPVTATAMPLINQVIQALANSVESSMLAASLRSRIDKIAELEVGLTNTNTTLETETGVLSTELLGLRNDLADAIAYVQESRTIEITERQALVTQLNTQLAQIGSVDFSGLYAAIEEETTTRALETGELFAQKILKFDLAGNVSGYGLSAHLDPDGTSTSDFQVRADTFSLAPPSVVQDTAPTSVYNGKVWVDTSVTPNVTRWYNTTAGAWQTTPVKGAVPFIVKTAPEVIDGFTVPPGVYIDTALIGKLTADKIDARGLSIKDPDGNIILAAGSSLDWSKLGGAANNLSGLGYTGALDATRNVYRGAWVTATLYKVGDVTTNAGSSWSARVDHTSANGTNNPPTLPTTSNTWWELSAAKGDIGSTGPASISAVLSNEAHVFPAAADGTVSSYTGSGTEIRVYEGATELSYDGVGTANGTWKVTPAVDNITAGALTDSGTYLTVGQHLDVAAGTDASSITYTITGKTASGTGFTITKAQTFGKSKQGAGGLTGPAGPAVVVNSNRATTFTSTDGTLDAAQADIVFTASVSGVASPTYVWSFSGFQTAPTNSESATQTITSAQFGTAKSAIVTCTVSGTYKDDVTIVRLEKSTAAAGATVGATIGVNLGGQITSENASGLINDNAIPGIKIGGVMQSTNFESGFTGWRLDKATGAAEFGAAAIRGQLTASQIDTRELTIKDQAGNVVISAGSGWCTNLVINSEMRNNVFGYDVWTDVVGSDAGIYLIQPNSTFAAGNYGAVQCMFTGSFGDWVALGTRPQYQACSPGQRFESQALVTTINCTAKLYLRFLNKDKQHIGDYAASGGVWAAGPNAPYTQLWGFTTAPENAAFVSISLLGTRNIDTETHSYLTMTKPFLGLSSVYQKEMTVWSPGQPQINPETVRTFISDLSVDTLQIAGNAVTVPLAASVTNAGAVYIDMYIAPSEIPAGSTTIPVLVSASVIAAAGQIGNFDLTVGNPVTFAATGNIASTTVIGGNGLASADTPYTYQTVVNLPSGTHVFMCHRRGGDSGYDGAIKKRTISIMLARR